MAAASQAASIEFPIACETCLGENPYLRMLKNSASRQCRVCDRPYTSFRWQPGRKARYKTTVICQTCARIKNVCQVCVFDLKYGLPVGTRDKLLQAQGAEIPHIPAAQRNRDYALNRVDLDNLKFPSLALSDQTAAARLEGVAQRTAAPRYRRNLPRICTFWQKGACDRGDDCPFRHEDDVHNREDIASVSIPERYRGDKDPLAEAMLATVLPPAAGTAAANLPR